MTGRDTLLSHDVGWTSQSPQPGTGHQRLNVFVGTWHTEGQQCEGPQMPGKSVKVRCTTAFSDAGKTMRSKWEQSSDASSWATFWDVKPSKAK